MNHTLTQATFKELVLENKRLSVIHFKTEWNGACQIMAPVFEDLAKIYKEHADFFTVDMEAEKKLGDFFGIAELPVILFLKNGEVMDHHIGLVPKSTLKEKIEKALTNK